MVMLPSSGDHVSATFEMHRILLVLTFAAAAASPLAAQRAPGSPPPRRMQVRGDDGHALTVWAKRPVGSPRGSILLLHGRTWSSLPNFDLQVSGQHVSMMDALIARGYAVYALDQRGYGATPRDGTEWLTPSRAANDALVVLRWIARREGGAMRPALFGYSQGSLTSMLAALRDSSALSALVLYGFPRNITADTGAPPADPIALARRRTTLAAAEEDFITPESTPRGVKEAYARAAVAADPVRTDWRQEAQWRALDPAALRVPVLLINGERDPYAARANLPAFMARAAGVDRSWVVLARADHGAHLERQREFVDALVAFLATSRVKATR
jgi:pimeloyl-ACP methyl ester carboxylesterase